MTAGDARTWLIGLIVVATASVALSQDAARPAGKPADQKLAPGCTPWSQKKFVHPPLACMEPYTRIDEYPIVAWCFHSRNPTGRFVVGDEFAADAKALGFNVLIDVDGMLEPCRRNGMKLLAVAFSVEPPVMKARFFQGDLADHPALLGVIQDDDCTAVNPVVRRTSAWMRANYPHVIPLISKYPPSPQSDTAIRVLMTMNYPFLRGARGEKATASYCSECNSERNFCNSRDMGMWVIFGGGNVLNQIRFQMMTAMAYGAQGLVNFAYTPTRVTTPWYHPGNPMAPTFKKMHDYMSQVIGRHLWGTMCLDVFHSPHGGEHRGAPHPAADKIIVNMSEFYLVGLLTPQAKFQSKDPADRAVPEYFLMVDKRTGGATPELRDSFMMLNPATVPVVEFLGPDANDQLRKLVPGYKIRVKTEGGEGFLVRVAPDLEKLLGGKEGLKLYAEINKTLAALQGKIDPPAGQPAADGAAAAQEADRVAAAARAKVAELEKVLQAAVAAGAISKAQAEETLKGLKAAIEATASEAKGRP